MTAPARKFLGRSNTAASRTSVYQAADGFDVESREQYEVVQRRVLYDDILFVTYHREKGVLFLVLTGLYSLLFIAITLAILSVNVNNWPAALIIGAVALPGILAFLSRLLFGVDVITIFGRRSKAAMRFAFRKKHARNLYGQICAAVRTAQRVHTPVAAVQESASVDMGPGPDYVP
jgi:uncharacterized integral membrane protein